jgi:hypothetical protein
MVRRGQRTDPRVRREIEFLAGEGFGPAEIEGRLAADSRFTPAEVPSLRSIQSLARSVRGRKEISQARPWRLAESEPEDIPAILPVLLASLEVSDRRHALTGAEADWVVRISHAAPDIPADLCYRLAFRAAFMGGPPGIELYLACAPWRPGGAERYARLFADGYLDRTYVIFRDEYTDEAINSLGRAIAGGPA